MRYQILGNNVLNNRWDGSQTILSQYQGATMPQTPNGSLVLGYWNKSALNSDGTLIIRSGGGEPISLDVPALAGQPSLLIRNWQAGDLNITNTSANAKTPVAIEAFGPGIPGLTPKTWTVESPVQLASLEAAYGTTGACYMQFILTSNTGDLTIVALIGGPKNPAGTNAYLFAVNFPSGRDSTTYTKVTQSNSLTFQFNWGSFGIYAANMSASNASAATVRLLAL